MSYPTLNIWPYLFTVPFIATVKEIVDTKRVFTVCVATERNHPRVV